MARRMTGRAWPGVVGLLGLTLALVLFAGAPAWGPLLLVAFATVYAAGLWRWSRARIRAARYRPPQGWQPGGVWPTGMFSFDGRPLSNSEAEMWRRYWQHGTDLVSSDSRLRDLAGKSLWRVERGDTLVLVAATWQVPIGQLAAVNRISSPATVQLGWVLQRPYMSPDAVTRVGLDGTHGPVNLCCGTYTGHAPQCPVAVHDSLVVGEQWCDPAWSNAISELSEQRRRLAARLATLQARVKGLRIALRNNPTADEDLRAELESQQAELDGQRVVMLQAGRHAGIRSVQDWIAVPREDVVDLPRATRAACDCRYGHYDFHAITGFEDDRVFRECAVCEPPTRWVETGAAS